MSAMRVDTQRLRSVIKAQGITQKRLAQEAGLSRQALHAVLSKEKAEVREKTLKGLLAALKLADESALLDDALAGYKRLVAEAHEQFDFHGLSLPHADPLPLDDLFVAVRLRATHLGG